MCNHTSIFEALEWKVAQKKVFVKFYIADFNTTWCLEVFSPESVDRSSFQLLLKCDKMTENLHKDLLHAFQHAVRESVAKYLSE